LSDNDEMEQQELEEDEDQELEEELASELNIESWDDMFKALCIAKGIDPAQIQSMAKFSNFDNNDERSYYPNQMTSIAIAQLRMFGRAFYKDDEWNEYEAIADLLSVGFMGFKGFKSEQWKDITSGQPNLDKLKGIPEETQKSILSGIFGKGGKTE
jgi:hypothetical protein